MNDKLMDVAEKLAGVALKATAGVAKTSAKVTAKVLAFIPQKASKMAKKQFKDIPLDKKVFVAACTVAVAAALCGCKKHK